MKKLTLLLITLCMLITTTYAYNLTKIVNNNKLTTSVDEGTSVTITYTDVAGYTFTSWTATGVTLANSTSKEITFVMPANDVTVTPNATTSTKYTFTRTINNVTETSQKTPGESITVTAVPKSGYEFTGWTATGITVANTATITFTMPSNDVTLVANFEESAHVHEYSVATCTVPPTCSCGATNGSALGHTWNNATCTAPKTCSVCGTTEGNALSHSYTGTRICDENGNTDTVQCANCTSIENQECTHTYTITVTQGSNGVISPASATVKAGGRQTFSITPNSGYEIADVLVNGASVGKVTSYTISNVKSNQTITASFRVEIVVNTDTSGANAPVIKTGLTPVNWNGTSWETTTESNWKYNYNTVATATHSKVEGNGDGAWANAQTSDGSIYVWIPRYSYKIASGEHSDGNSWNSLDTPGTNKIEIKFSNGTIDDTSEFIAHPAFNFGGTQLEGIWVAKYEASRNDATADSEGNGTTPVSKAGVTPWTSLTISEIFSIAYNLNRTLDSHMMKNTEWGAVAYLTNAIGRIPYTNTSYYMTGCAGESQEDSAYDYRDNPWNTVKGVKASTTHNIYGIYDMSGGNLESLAAYVDIDSDDLTTYASNLVNAVSKYKDVYSESTFYSENSAIKGDALYEVSNAWGYSLGAWDSDNVRYYIPSTEYQPTLPFFCRGGQAETAWIGGCGIFHLECYSTGGAFRVVLSVL